VPGDGDIPLSRIIGQLLDAGYDGVFDIEIIGSRIEDEGYESAIRRSLGYLDELLEPAAERSAASDAT
jgi:sugar phosphate isomerase/epimerase